MSDSTPHAPRRITDERAKRISKRLSYVLRHDPDSVGLSLDAAGWTDVDALLDALARHRVSLSRNELEEVVRTSDKQRFALSEDGLRIRANQGHSVAVDLGYEPATPPEFLYHGTVEQFLAAIAAEGLKRGSRTHVHLSPDVTTATAVGRRRGKPIILQILARQMRQAGYVFYVTPNNVWLVDHVPPQFVVPPLGGMMTSEAP